MVPWRIQRKVTKKIMVGDVPVGGDAPITVQSMTATDTRNIDNTIQQIQRLTEVGCDIVRVAVMDMQAAKALNKIKAHISIPLVADIHFDYRLALASIENGADKIRINPGNIGSVDRVKEVVKKAKLCRIPIRIGVNAGSIEKELLKKYGHPTPEALVESAARQVAILEQYDFTDIALSLKASNVPLTVAAYRLSAQRFPYPIHLGITEAGTVWSGTIKSSVGLGTLLMEGIGDTIRVSLTGQPEEEVKVASQILKSLSLKRQGVEIISCPTCGRCQIDLINIANTIEEKLQNIDKDIKIAVMGCAVNGPGEAREADIGIAGGKGEGLIFKKGEIIKKVKENEIIDSLLAEIDTMKKKEG